MDGLLNTLKRVHKIFADFTKFVFSNVELLHKIRRL
jgi:hypothetical protein